MSSSGRTDRAAWAPHEALIEVVLDRLFPIAVLLKLLLAIVNVFEIALPELFVGLVRGGAFCFDARIPQTSALHFVRAALVPY